MTFSFSAQPRSFDCALTVLAILIPQSDLVIYPIEIFVGVTVLMGLAKLTDALAEARGRFAAQHR